MSKSEKKLGRGLDALLPRKSASPKITSVSSDNENTISDNITGRPLSISVNKIIANKKQPRSMFTEEDLSELSASIKEQGIIQPLIVRESGKKFELIAGERRLRAAKMAKLSEVPVMIMDIADNNMLESALVENLQRADLNIIEIANGYQTLIDDLNLTHDKVAKKIGISRVAVTNTLRILSLPKEVQQIVSRGTISMGHARALLALDTPLQQINLAKKITEENLSVRETEKLVKTGGSFSSKKSSKKKKILNRSSDAVIKDYEDRLRHILGTKVKVNDKGGKGEITIEYYSNEDFGRIVSLLGVED